MKNILPILLGAALLPLAAQATSTSNVVGYETLTITPSAFNYLGIRLHEPIAIAGTFETVGTNSVTDTGQDFSSVSDSNTFYIIEIDDGSGIISEFLGSAVSGDTITTTDDLQAAGVANGASYRIRPASTIASVFGAANEAGLAEGFGGPSGADQIYVPDGSGGFDQYYYDTFGGWTDAVTLSSVTPDAIPLVYADGVIISASASAPASIIVSGEVKNIPTQLALLGTSFNYTSPVAPAGATLEVTFDPTELNQGFGGPSGADIVYVPNGAGFDRYYYDQFGGWTDVSTLAPVDPKTVNLPSGIVISNAGAAKPVLAGVPSYYSTL